MFISTALAATSAGDGSFPPFEPTYFASQLLWLTITFGVFYLIMSRVVIPRLAGILESRHDRITRDVDETQRLQAEADAAQAAFEHALAEARTNAHAIAGKATEKAKQDAASARAKVEAELAEKLSAAEAEITAIKQKALAEVDTIAADTAAEIVNQLIGSKLNKAQISKAITAGGK